MFYAPGNHLNWNIDMDKLKVVLHYPTLKITVDEDDEVMASVGANEICEYIYDILVNNIPESDILVDPCFPEWISDIISIRDDKNELLGDRYEIEDVEIDSVRGLSIIMLRDK